MADFVLDASLTLAWCFEDERTGFSDAMLSRLEAGESAMTPALWGLEVGNGIRSAVKRGRIAAADVGEQLRFLRYLPVRMVDQSRRTMLEEITPLALEHDLSAYDAAYFHLARQHDLPLATLDGLLRRAAEKADWPVIAPQ
ncbi:MAG TPA: type II toxin-antitoxin system VapC family toxin [Chloroflexota bacterium]|nr:type II toxin-antitoxin system VapC family toxin [Chloroflexota bacterium]